MMFPIEGSIPSGAPGEDEIRDADALGLELVRFVRLVNRAKSQFTAQNKSSVESAAYALLVHLVGDGPQRLTALAESVHSDTSTVSRQIGALVRHGLVERRADPMDGRACLLAATDDGEKTFWELRRMRNEHFARLLAGWPREDIHTLVSLLDRLNTDMENSVPGRDSESAGVVRPGGENQ